MPRSVLNPFPQRQHYGRLWISISCKYNQKLWNMQKIKQENIRTPAGDQKRRPMLAWRFSMELKRLTVRLLYQWPLSLPIRLKKMSPIL